MVSAAGGWGRVFGTRHAKIPLATGDFQLVEVFQHGNGVAAGEPGELFELLCGKFRLTCEVFADTLDQGIVDIDVQEAVGDADQASFLDQQVAEFARDGLKVEEAGAFEARTSRAGFKSGLLGTMGWAQLNGKTRTF